MTFFKELLARRVPRYLGGYLAAAWIIVEFIDWLVMFPFDNDAGNPENEWLRNGVPDMVQYDLVQDIYLDLSSPYQTYDRIREAGLQEAATIPLTLKRKITEDQHMLRGEIRQALNTQEKRIGELEKITSPINLVDKKSETVERYIMAGDTASAYRIAKEAETYLVPPFDNLNDFINLNIFLRLEETGKAEKALEGVKQGVENLKLEMVCPLVLEGEGRLHELKGEYDLAIQNYLDQLKLEPTDSNIHLSLGRCYRKVGNSKKATYHLQKVLNIHPNWPRAHLEMALVYEDEGQRDQAVELLRRALEIWENADPGYQPAAEAADALSRVQ